MDVSALLDGLNDKQRDAVAAAPISQLVLAGAGSGKTRVLVHRIAWLMQVEQISPYAIMAVTFTNKAAAEMRGRTEHLLHGSVRGMWLGTFHSLAHRLLRTHYQEAKLPESFQILDADDQQRLLRRTIKALNLDEKKWPARQAMWFINSNKDEGLRPQHIDSHKDPVQATWLRIYKTYQDTCDNAGLVDFAELLLRAHELFLQNPLLLNHYRERFQHILVDEFQDTNTIQYAWIRLLAGEQNKVMIVGDDDQSIYGWRGARVENIQRFLDEFPGAQTVRLEQNYRSTSTILNAANQVIANNTERLGKQLWTEGSEGEPIALYAAFNELDEARFIVSQLKGWQEQGGNLSDCAILYRSNAQSRVLEEALIQAGMPYRIYGGMRFFERQEIKDALGYLRLIANRRDDAAYERVVNTPTRGIGDRTLEKIRHHARSEGCGMWEASSRMLDARLLTGRAANALNNFRELIDWLEEALDEQPLHKQVDVCMKHSGLLAMYETERGEKAQARVENLQELVTAARQFEPPEDAAEMAPLDAFLSHAALESGEGQADEFDDAVQLMTLHAAKGLEFPLVLMSGVEEGMFPSMMSGDDPERMEEERRLCYVGMTRAMQRLVISYAENRRMYGQDHKHRPSRFIKEIPAQYLQEVRPRASVNQPLRQSRFQRAASSVDVSGFQLGQRVLHPKFGEGTVTNYEGSGPQTRLQIEFDQPQIGAKWLMLSYARLEAL